MLWVCPPIIIQNTSISHAKRQVFNRAPNFVIAPRLFTFQNTSNSQSKTYLRTFFLQNSSQWLLSQMSVIFLGRQKQKQLSIPPLCLIRKSIFRILIFHERLQGGFCSFDQEKVPFLLICILPTYKKLCLPQSRV